MSNSIEVGRTSSGKVWIGRPREFFEAIESALLKRKFLATELDEEETRWLIGALRKELEGSPEDDVEEWMD